MVTEIGTCAPGGALDSICRLGCSEGYEASHIAEGRCLPRWFAHDEVAVAEYTGQNVTCTPEMNKDGSMAESWCRMERDEALRSCCASAGSSEPACGPDAPPQACELPCAEVWLPLSRSCEQYFAADELLTAQCEDVASAFLGVAPATVQISGFACHPLADGEYHIGSRTVGGKPYWRKLPTESGGPTFYLYAVVEPHSGYAIGESLSSYDAWLETYENLPPVSRASTTSSVSAAHAHSLPTARCRSVHLIRLIADFQAQRTRRTRWSSPFCLLKIGARCACSGASTRGTRCAARTPVSSSGGCRCRQATATRTAPSTSTWRTGACKCCTHRSGSKRQGVGSTEGSGGAAWGVPCRQQEPKTLRGAGAATGC